MGEAPFSRVYLHGTVRDIQGRKMSKSLGNGVDPLEVVELYGADALRFTVIASAGIGADIRLDHEDLEASFAPGRNFVNKLWNAGRFALMSLGDEPVLPIAQVADDLHLEDRWILSRQQHAVRRVDEELDAFRIHGAAEVLRDFFRGDFADWYLESVKHRLRPGGPGREAARSVLVHVLDGVCRLLHPMIPFVTEEMWGMLPGSGDRDGPLIVARWPVPSPGLTDPQAEAGFEWLRELIVRVRGLRKEYRVGEGTEVALYVTGGASAELLAGREEMLRRLARIAAVQQAPPPPNAAGAGAVLRDGTEVFLPLEGVIDVERERTRVAREMDRLAARMKGLEKKLANENFLTRAPEAVVERERQKLASCKVQFTKWKVQLTSLAAGDGVASRNRAGAGRQP